MNQCNESKIEVKEPKRLSWSQGTTSKFGNLSRKRTEFLHLRRINMKVCFFVGHVCWGRARTPRIGWKPFLARKGRIVPQKHDSVKNSQETKRVALRRRTRVHVPWSGAGLRCFAPSRCSSPTRLSMCRSLNCLESKTNCQNQHPSARVVGSCLFPFPCPLLCATGMCVVLLAWYCFSRLEIGPLKNWAPTPIPSLQFGGYVTLKVGGSLWSSVRFAHP